MKKYFFVLFLLVNVFANNLKAQSDFNNYPQKNIYATPINTPFEDQRLNQFNTFKVYQINSLDLAQYARTITATTNLNIDFANTQPSWQTTIEPNDLKGNNFVVRMITENGEVQAPILANNTFKGNVFGIENSEVRLTIDQGFIYGFIKKENQTLFIEPLNRFVNTPTNADYYIVYDTKDLNATLTLNCGVVDNPNIKPFGGTPNPTPTAACIEIDLAVAADYSMFQKYKGPAPLVTYILGVMNNVEANYKTPFSSEIKFKISEFYISACPKCNFITDTISVNVLLPAFSSWGQNKKLFANPFDLAAFWSNRDFDGPSGGVIGVAYLSAVCRSNKYQILQDFQASNAQLTRVLVAHETGHNLSAQHDAGGSAFIMAPSVSSATNFSPNTIASVNAFLANSTTNCLSPCIAPDCPEIKELKLESIFNAGITLTWAENAQKNYKVQWRIDTARAFAEADSKVVKTNGVSITGLRPNTKYQIQVKTDCGNNKFGQPIGLIINTLGALTPNPTNDFIAFDLFTETLTELSYDIVDYNGKFIYYKTVKLIKGINNVRVNFPYNAGVYVFRLKLGNNIINTKIVKVDK